MKLLVHNSKTPHGSPRSARVRPAPDSILLPALCHTVFNHRLSLPHPRVRSPPLPYRLPPLQHLSFAPFNLHKARVRRASGFLLTAFSEARLNPLFRSILLTEGAPPKKH
jgi:hypothetical protein